MVSRAVLLFSVAALSCAPAISVAAPAAPAQTAPLTAAPETVAMAERLVAAIDANDPALLERWIDDCVDLQPTKPRSVWVDSFGGIARTVGGLTLLRVDQANPSTVRVHVRTGVRGLEREFRLYIDPSRPGKAINLAYAIWPARYGSAPLAADASEKDVQERVADRVEFGAGRDQFSGVAAVYDRGRLVARQTRGMADAATGRPVAPDTRFHIGSMDKMFTAVAIGQLVEQGRLRFDSRLIDVLPDYPNPDAARKITIEQLLSHSAGLASLGDEDKTPYVKDFSRMSDDLAGFASLPLAYEPGTRAGYTNDGFVVLGAVVERLSGRSWYEYVAENIFRPAGMEATGYDFSDALNARSAVGYRFAPEDPLGVRDREPNTAKTRDRGGSAGGGYSTAADMTRFLNAFRDGRLVSPAIVDVLVTPVPNGLNQYAKGFFVYEIASRKVVGNSGGGPNSGIDNQAMIVWDTGWSVAVLGNYDAPAAQSVSMDLLRSVVSRPSSS